MRTNRAAPAASIATAAQVANRDRYAASDGSTAPAMVIVLTVSRLPPTALASELPRLRASEFRPLAAASSAAGV
jgi:hypothetical protein